MAIDSIDKRKSAAWTSMYVAPTVEPDNTQPLEWRQTVGFGYYGISVTGSGTTIVVSTGAQFRFLSAEGLIKSIGVSEVNPTAFVFDSSGTNIAIDTGIPAGTFVSYQLIGGFEHLDPGAQRKRRHPDPRVPSRDRDVDDEP